MKFHFLIIVVFGVLFVNAQVGINNTDPKAQLDISSSNQSSPSVNDGILIPRIDQFPSSNPSVDQNSMLIFLTTTDGTNEPGFYYWNHSTTQWLPIDNNGVKRIDDLEDGKSDSDGSQNGSSIFLGIQAGEDDNSAHNRNVGIGYQSLKENSNGKGNTALGHIAMLKNTSGSYNVAIGMSTLSNNISGNYNVGIGPSALASSTSASYNTAVGSGALYKNTGSSNSALGNSALSKNTSGSHNIAIGSAALSNNETSSSNIAIGNQALLRSDTNSNIAIGRKALSSLQSGGDRNIAIGNDALTSNDGSNNIAIGHQADRYSTASNQVTIGNSNNNSYRIFASGWTNISDRSLKKDITSIPIGLEFVKKLNPVEFIYKNSKNNRKTYGFIAQDVKQALKESDVKDDVIVVDFDKQLLGMNQIEIIPVLTKAIQEQQKEIEDLKQKIITLEKIVTKLNN